MRFDSCCMLWLGLQLLCASLARAQPDRPTTAATATALLSVEDADPLELARIVRRAGDAAVLDLLAANQTPAIRLAAVRAAPWLSEPELALLALASLIVTRDSDLAEAAARAALEITRKLDGDVLVRRELVPGELSPAARELRRAARQSWVRADLRLMAAVAVAELEAAGVPLPDSK